MIARKIFGLYLILYIFIYTGYILYIHLLRPTYSMLSLSAILLPFILLLTFQWFLWKCTKGGKKAKTQFITISLLSFILPLCCGIMLGLNEHRSNFSTERWLHKPAERVYIVDDLLSQYKLTGKTREEIHKLLGAPTETEYFKEKNNIVYYLGDERGFIRIDSEWLVIWFNDSDEVIKFSIDKD